jgi:hypothetical protein
MMRFFSITSALAILTIGCPAADKPDVFKSTGKIATPKPLSEQQQKALLTKRQSGAMSGSLDSYSSLMYAVHGIILHSDEDGLGQITLRTPFPKFYKPTGAELLNAIARQTATSWSYDSKRAYWLFSKPGKPMPFEITLSEGWVSEDRGYYLWCKPPTAPIGMDVYAMGEFSSESEDQNLAVKMRGEVALMWAKMFKKDVTLADMTAVKVGKIDALFFKVPTPRPGSTWRQWAIAVAGKSVVIVSVIDDDKEKDILPDVEAAVNSFKLKP